VSDLYPDQQDWKEPECDEACEVVNGLRSELEQVRGERDAMSNLYAHEGHKSLVLLNENTSLLAENRVLSRVVQTARLFLEANPGLNGTGPLRGDVEALDCSPSVTAAEVERVRRLETFVEWVAAGEPSPTEYDPSEAGRDDALTTGNSGDSEAYGILTMYYNMAQKAKAALAALGEGES